MNKTKIEWCSHTWNPVTGCFHGCPYCYARNIACRFAHKTGKEERAFLKEEGILTIRPDKTRYGLLYELHHPVEYSYPFTFQPTFRRYLLNEPAAERKSRDIFVCSMADLFGRWVPFDWIRDVFDACAAAPQHRYLFLTKNPLRYWELNRLAMLPHDDNFWYGVTVTDDNAERWYRYDGYHLFWSVEPLLGPLEMWITHSTEEAMIPHLPEWVIIGAQTGNASDKVIPERKWVDDIRAFCERFNIPVFYKDSLRKLFPDLPESRFPWKQG